LHRLTTNVWETSLRIAGACWRMTRRTGGNTLACNATFENFLSFGNLLIITLGLTDFGR